MDMKKIHALYATFMAIIVGTFLLSQIVPVYAVESAQTVEQTSDTFDFDNFGLVPAYRHTNPDGSIGGWVAKTASVDKTAFVGKEALVYVNARVSDNAQVLDNARV
mgnify:CR=1 FL=1